MNIAWQLMPRWAISPLMAALIGGLFVFHEWGEAQATRASDVGDKMDMQQAITAKRTSVPPTQPTGGAVDRLDALGQLLYGEQWITPMARDLKIHPDTLAEWAWGRRELPPDHPIFWALAILVHYHDKGVARAREAMNGNHA
jgi:hypothetical protein